MLATVAIVGRPNVGKSTLFNRLVGRREALVDDSPGVTRDRREGEGRLGPLRFHVVDTAGLEDATGDSLEARMLAQTEAALDHCEVALLLFDARAGVTPLDRHFAERLRRHGRSVILVANKCEGRAAEAGLYEAYSLGLGEPVAISAEHGHGMGLLSDALLDAGIGIAEDEGAAESVSTPLRLAIVGRPNAGKSTLINALIGEDRQLTGPEPGTTRDAITVDWDYKGRAISLIDTAGLRRRARVVEKLEKLSAADARRAIDFAHVVVVLIDATEVHEHGPAIEKQDLAIADDVVEEGRALVLAVNKWDRITERRALLERLSDSLEGSLSQVPGVPLVPISALTGRHLDRLLDAVLEVERLWDTRIPTAPLNGWLAEAGARHPPPLVQGRRIRLRYVTQVKARPPTFALFVGKPRDLPTAYLRYLGNSLREAFGLRGVPIRIVPRAGRNPYVGKKARR